VTVSCERGNEPSGTIKCFVDFLSIRAALGFSRRPRPHGVMK
jgi:hypothetical protein